MFIFDHVSILKESVFNSMKEYTDQEIIECLKQRKSYVIRYLSDRYQSMINLLVFQSGGTREDAKDIFQDALLIMLEKIDSNEFVLTCKFKTFLYCICENLWNNILMKRKAASNFLKRRSNDYHNNDFTEMYDNKIYENMFYDIFETLEPLCKDFLSLHWKDYTAKEIAAKLGYKDSYVRKKKCECQGELIRRINELPSYKALKLSQSLIDTYIYE